MEEVYLPPEDGPTELEASVSVADAGWAEQQARRANSQPGQVLWAVEWVAWRERGSGVRGGVVSVEEGKEVGRE